MISIETLMQMLYLADDETLVRLSRKNCHVKGLHSIVLSDNDGRLVRFYITSHEHTLFQNSHDGLFDLSLGVHSHKYDLVLTAVKGFDHASNLVYIEDPSGTDVKKYDYSVEQGAVYIGVSSLCMVSHKKIDIETMDSDTLRTVHVPEGMVACWLVEDGIETGSRHAELFSNSEIKFVKHQTFKSAEDVREFVEDLVYG